MGMFSQSYLFFWDKLNKANYYLELIIENADLPLNDRLIEHLSGGELIGDGGQWDMAANLINKYGVVPQTVFPESTHSSLSGPLNNLLKTKLREHALVLRRLHSSLKARSLGADAIDATLRAKKEELMKDVYAIMTATLGVPPMPEDSFTWEYYDKNGRFGQWEGTPGEFVKQFWSTPWPVSSFCILQVEHHISISFY
jgi:bleomycin hydrolase